MRHWGLGLALVILGSGSVRAELNCYYEKLWDGTEKQICFDPTKPKEADKEIEYLKSKVPRAGVFDGPVAFRDMQTSLYLQPPGNSVPFVLFTMPGALEFRGMSGGGPVNYRLEGVTVAEGQEGALARYLAWLLPERSALLVNVSSEFAGNGQPFVYLWKESSLLSVVLTERGFTVPVVAPLRYAKELEEAVRYAKEKQLGVFAPKS